MKEEQINLLVKIKSCRDLLVGDTTTSDPYVKVQLGLKDVHHTKHVLKTLNPVFSEDNHDSTFRLTIPKKELFDNRGLVFKVMDWDRFSFDDNLGASRVLPQPLYDSRGEDIEVKLFPPPERKGEDAGFLVIWACNETTDADNASDDEEEEKSEHSNREPTSTGKDDGPGGVLSVFSKDRSSRLSEKLAAADDEEDELDARNASNVSHGDEENRGGGGRGESSPKKRRPSGGFLDYFQKMSSTSLESDGTKEETPKTSNLTEDAHPNEPGGRHAGATPLIPAGSNDFGSASREMAAPHQHVEEGHFRASSSLPSVDDAKLDAGAGVSGENEGWKGQILEVVSYFSQGPRLCYLLIGVAGLLALIIGLSVGLKSDKDTTDDGLPPTLSSPDTNVYHVHSDIALMSDAFDDGDEIPVKYTADGDNISPPMSWSGVPPGTKSFVLICEDFLHGSDHWVAYNIPRWIGKLDEGVELSSEVDVSDGGSPAYVLQGANSLVESESSDFVHGYHGPDPLSGSGVHTYVFSLYAVDGVLEDVDPTFATSKAVTRAILSQGHTVLGTGILTGTYERD